jgi:hypothetical protein
MAKAKTVKLPSGYKVTESFLCRIVIEGEGDTLDMMALKEMEPQDLKFIFNVWLEHQLELENQSEG